METSRQAGDSAGSAESLNGRVGQLSSPSPWERPGWAGLVGTIAEDFRTNGSSLLSPGFIALSVHRLGEWLLTSAPAALRPLGESVRGFLFVFVRNMLGIEFSRKARIGRRVRIYHQHGIVVHPRSVVGDECVIMHDVTLGTRSGTAPVEGRVAPQLGAKVTLGVGCTLLGPVLVGDGASIGPHAVVTVNVPSGASVTAAPSRVVRL